jgi:2-dehydro-3-deoxyphosphogluconate aldolase/(4S)-4-hydroxy-2-oxoglutarate aldolase
MIKAGEFDKITALTKEAVELMLGFELKHVGINSKDEKEAEKTTSAFCDIFGFVKDERSASYFAGTGLEIMKMQGRGKFGHIAIATNSVERAIYHLSKRGCVFDYDSATYDNDGKIKFIYIKEDMGGFGVHLVNK